MNSNEIAQGEKHKKENEPQGKNRKEKRKPTKENVGKKKERKNRTEYPGPACLDHFMGYRYVDARNEYQFF